MSGSQLPESQDPNANADAERNKIRAIAEALRMGNDGKIEDKLVEGVMKAIEDEAKKVSTPARTALGNSLLEKVVNDKGDTEIKIIPQYNKIFTGSGTYIMWCSELEFKEGRKGDVMKRWQNFFTRYPFWCPHALRIYETHWSAQEIRDANAGDIRPVRDFKDGHNIRFYVKTPQHLYKGGEAKTSALMRYYDGLENSTCSSLTPEENLWTFATFFGTGGVNGKTNALNVETAFFKHNRIHDHLIPRLNEGGGTGISYTEMVFDLRFTEMKRVMTECQKEIVGQSYMEQLVTNVLGREFADKYNVYSRLNDDGTYDIITEWEEKPKSKDKELADKLWNKMGGEENLKKICPTIWRKRFEENTAKFPIVEFFANIYRYQQRQTSYFEADGDAMFPVYEMELEHLFSKTGYSKANEEANKKNWRVNLNVVLEGAVKKGTYSKSSKRTKNLKKADGTEGDTLIYYYEAITEGSGFIKATDQQGIRVPPKPTTLSKVAKFEKEWGCWAMTKMNKTTKSGAIPELYDYIDVGGGRRMNYIKIVPRAFAGAVREYGIYVPAVILEELFEIRTEVIDIPDLDNANEIAQLDTKQFKQDKYDADLQTILRVKRQANLFRDWYTTLTTKQQQQANDDYATLGEEGENMIRSTMPPDYKEIIDLTEDTASMVKDDTAEKIKQALGTREKAGLEKIWKTIRDSAALTQEAKDFLQKTFNQMGADTPQEAGRKRNANMMNRSFSAPGNVENVENSSTTTTTTTTTGSGSSTVDQDVNMKNGDTENSFSKLKIRF